MRKKAVKKVVKSVATDLVPAKNTTVPAKKSSGQESIPVPIRNNPLSLKIWENATEEEKLAGALLCEFQAKTNNVTITHYFDFADKWDEKFPKENKKRYEFGRQAIEKGSKMAGMSKESVWSILRTTKFYGRTGYESLNKKAQANGVTIYWSHLRLLSDKLSHDKAARTKIEQAMVQRQMTEKQLISLIEGVAPDAVPTKEIAGSGSDRSPLQIFYSLNSTLGNLAKQRAKFERAISVVNDEFDGDVEEAQIIFEQTSAFIAHCQEVIDFIEEQNVLVHQMHEAASVIVEGEKVKTKQKDDAAAIKYQLAQEKAEQQKKRQDRTEAHAARGDIATNAKVNVEGEEEEEEDYIDSDEDSVSVDDADIDVARVWDKMGKVVNR